MLTLAVEGRLLGPEERHSEWDAGVFMSGADADEIESSAAAMDSAVREAHTVLIPPCSHLVAMMHSFQEALAPSPQGRTQRAGSAPRLIFRTECCTAHPRFCRSTTGFPELGVIQPH